MRYKLLMAVLLGLIITTGMVQASRPLHPDTALPLLPARIMNENLLLPVVRPPITRTDMFEEETDVSWLILPGDFLLSTGVGEGEATLTFPANVIWREAAPVRFERVEWGAVMAAGNLARLQAVSIPFTLTPVAENIIRVVFDEGDLIPAEPGNNPNFIIIPLRADFTDAPTGILQVNTQVERTGTSQNTNIPVSLVPVRNLGAFTVGTLPAAATFGPAVVNTWTINEGFLGNFFATAANTDPLRGLDITLSGNGQFTFMGGRALSQGVFTGHAAEGLHIHFPVRDVQLPVFATHEQGFLWAFNNARPAGYRLLESFSHAATLSAQTPERVRFDAYFVGGAPPIVSPITGEILNLYGLRPRALGLNYAFLSDNGRRLHIILAGNDMGNEMTAAGSLQIVNARVQMQTPIGAEAVTVTATAANRGGLPAIPSATQNIFRFAQEGLTLTATTATTVSAGHTFTAGFTEQTIFAIDHMLNVTARINLVEATPNAIFGPWNAPTLELTDAYGNPLHGVSIAGAQMGGNLITGGTVPLPPAGLAGLNRHVQNAAHAHGSGRWLSEGINAALQGGTMLRFTAGSLTFLNTPMAVTEQGLAVAFRLGIAPGFSGPIYVTVHNHGEVIDTVHIANAVSAVSLVLEYERFDDTGALLFPLPDIIVREHAPGALLYGDITLTLSPAWMTSLLSFPQLSRANIQTTNGLSVVIRPALAGQIRLEVTNRSLGAAGEVRLSGLYLLRLIPFAETIYITLGGSAVHDSTHEAVPLRFFSFIDPDAPPPPVVEVEIDAQDEEEEDEEEDEEEAAPEPTPTPALTPTPPPLPAPVELPTIRLLVDSPIVRVNARHALLQSAHGELTPVRSEEGRVFVPIRGLVEIFYGTLDFVWNDGLLWADITIGAAHIRFTEHNATFQLNGKDYPMAAATVVFDGSMYVPVRYLAEALGMTVQWARSEGETVVYIAPAPPPAPHDEYEN